MRKGSMLRIALENAGFTPVKTTGSMRFEVVIDFKELDRVRIAANNGKISDALREAFENVLRQEYAPGHKSEGLLCAAMIPLEPKNGDPTLTVTVNLKDQKGMMELEALRHAMVRKKSKKSAKNDLPKGP